MLSLIEMSLAGGILIAVIVIVRAVAVNKLPKQVFLALWAVALLRLVLPFAIPSPTSVYSAARTLGVTMRRPGILLSQVGSETTASESAIPVALIVWAGIALVLALTFLIVHLRSRRSYQASLPVEEPFVKDWLETHRLRRPVQVRYSDQVESPFTYGFLWPVIVLPKSLLRSDERKLSFVLAHELSHVRRFDALWKWVLAAVLCVHWFNPLVWVMYLLAGRDLELSCDQSVVKEYGRDARAPYALTLVDLEEKRTHLMPLASSFSKNAMEERITAIMKLKKTTLAGIAVALVLVVAVITVFATSAPSAKTSGLPSPSPKPSVSVPPAATPTSSITHPPAEPADPDDWNDGIPQYTQAQYDTVKNTLQFAGWEGMSIAEFNSKINAIFNDSESSPDGKYENSLHYAYEMVLMSLPDTDPLAPYLRNTVQASQDEYQARLSEVYSGKQQDPQFSGNAVRTQEDDIFGDKVSREFAQAQYSFSYRILDQDSLSVAERDQFLQDVMQGAQDYLDSKTLGQLIDDTDGEANFKIALEASGKAASNSKISFTGCEIDYYENYGYN